MNNHGPLSGIKAIACSTAQAGTVPYMLMADMGAEIIKIELPGKGDGSRKAGEVNNGVSSFFETNNRGVKSFTLNLKSDQGKEILYKLVKKADVIIFDEATNALDDATEKEVIESINNLDNQLKYFYIIYFHFLYLNL